MFYFLQSVQFEKSQKEMAVHKTQVTVKYALIFNVTSFSFQFFQMEHGVRLRPSLQFFT